MVGFAEPVILLANGGNPVAIILQRRVFFSQQISQLYADESPLSG
jgi:hypothetical protein